MSRFKLVPPAALIAAALLAGAWMLGRALDRDARRSEEGAKLLDAVMQRVRDSYVEPVDEEQLWLGAIAGMMNELGDPNSAYITPERLERLREIVIHVRRERVELLRPVKQHRRDARFLGDLDAHLGLP